VVCPLLMPLLMPSLLMKFFLNMVYKKDLHKQDNQWKISHLPKIELFNDNSTYDSTFLVHPNPFRYRKYQDKEGQRFANVNIGISPLKDKVYIFDIKVDEDRQRKGFGLAILKSLYDEFNSPLVAIKELHSAKPFWDKARELSGETFIVLPEIHGEEDIALEKERIKTKLLARKVAEPASGELFEGP
jgi:hypothetical protein